jgi:hypothetical protein
MLLFEFIILTENIIIVEWFDALGLLQNLLQPFINNLLLL